MVDDADDVLLRVVREELDDGREFLAAKGYEGAELVITEPDRLGIRTLELGGRLGDQPSGTAHVVVNIDPGRVGWTVEASLSIWPDADPSSQVIELGQVRVSDPSDPDSWARVVVRRAYVRLWEYLKGDFVEPSTSDIPAR